MTVFTVHARSGDHGDPFDPASDVVFVRDGFSPVALVFGGFWFVWHGMWLVLAAYVALAVCVAAAVAIGGVHPAGAAMLQSLLAFAVGVEAANLRRWSVERAGFREVSVVSGRNQDDAELRYFAHTDHSDADANVLAARTVS